jgi:transposase
MKARFRYRVYPHLGQQVLFAKTFGCARVVYNDGRRMQQQAHALGQPYIDDTELQKQVITRAKKTPERAWLAEVSSVALVQSLQDLHKAFRNFFDSATGKRKGAKVGHPRLKKKTDEQGIRFTENPSRKPRALAPGRKGGATDSDTHPIPSAGDVQWEHDSSDDGILQAQPHARAGIQDRCHSQGVRGRLHLD